MEEKSKAFTWITRIITIVSVIGFAAFAIFLGVQLWRSTTYDRFDYLEITPAFKESYSKNSEVLTRPVGKEGLSEEGIVKVTELAYITSEGGYDYVQFNVRFNKRHVDDITEQCPGFDYDDVHFVLIAKSGAYTKEYNLTVIDKDDKYQYRYIKYEVTDIEGCDSIVLEMRLSGIEKYEDEGGKTAIKKNPDSFYALEDRPTIQEKDGGSYEYSLSKSEKNKLNEK